LGTYNTGSRLVGIAFDGQAIWVSNENSYNVAKLQASDGALLGTFGVPGRPQGIAFDGVNIWVACQASSLGSSG